MRTPALALGWEMWRQHRWAFVSPALYLLGLAAVAQALRPERIDEGAVVLALIPLAVAIPFVLAAFLFVSDLPFENRRSCFPERLFTLPVTTAALVAYPMLYAGLVALGGWTALSVGVLRPCGVAAHIVWPALLIAAVVAWMQALIWFPFAIPFIRIIILAPLVTALLLGPPLASSLGAPGWALVVGLLGMLGAAYPLAVVGVARARRGEGGVWTWPAWLDWSGWWVPRADFASPQQAQGWIERRRSAPLWLIGVPLWTLAVLLEVPLAESALLEEARSGRHPTLAALAASVGVSWLALAQLLGIPLLLVPRAGLGAVGSNVRRPEMSSFQGARPLTTADLLRAKLWTAALGTLCVWGAVLGAGLLWAMTTGRWKDMADRLTALGGGRAWVALVLTLAVLAALNWTHLVAGLWPTLLGRPRVLSLHAFCAVAGAVCLIALSGALYLWPAWRAALASVLPGLLAGLVALKLLLAGWAVRQLLQRRLLAAATVGWVVAAWALFAAALFALLAWLIPPAWAGRGILAGAAVLAVPLARCLVAPLALAANRHR
jgi:hypothetical protein